MDKKRVIVAGAGLIGCATAWRLAVRGARVTVIESARPGGAASWAAAGMLAPLIEAEHQPLRTLAVRSIADFPRFVQALQASSGVDAELQLSGKLDVAFSAAELAILRGRYGRMLPDGVSEISTAQARSIEPTLAADAHAALLTDGDGSVDPRKLTRAAWLAAANEGVEFRTDTSVREVVCSRNVFEAVHLSTGERLAGDAVVIASGAWSGSIRGLPLTLPVVPVRGQLVVVERVPRILDRIIMTTDCYIVPRADGRVLIGSTLERVGFDPRTTATGIATLLNAALRVVPALGEARVSDSWAGLRPGTSDDLPILGGDPRAAGVFYATGHFKNGILLAPITADILSALVMGERTIMDISTFSAARFHE